jgi:hypothetical protein
MSFLDEIPGEINAAAEAAVSFSLLDRSNYSCSITSVINSGSGFGRLQPFPVGDPSNG